MGILDRIISFISPYRFSRIDYKTPCITDNNWKESLNRSVFDYNRKKDSILIHIHGWLESYVSGSNKSNYIGYGMNKVGYEGSVIGFLWNSYKRLSSAKKRAFRMGKKLANLIERISKYNSNIDVNISSHSLGTVLALSCVEKLCTNIENVFLMGGYVSHNDIGVNQKYDTEKIKLNNDQLYNFYCPNDEVLKYGQKIYRDWNPIGMSKNSSFNNIMFTIDNHSSYYTNTNVFESIHSVIS